MVMTIVMMVVRTRTILHDDGDTTRQDAHTPETLANDRVTVP